MSSRTAGAGGGLTYCSSGVQHLCMAGKRITSYTEEWRNLRSLMETLHLLRSPRNAQRLRDAIAEVEAGNVVPADLVDGEIAEQRERG